MFHKKSSKISKPKLTFFLGGGGSKNSKNEGKLLNRGGCMVKNFTHTRDL